MIASVSVTPVHNLGRFINTNAKHRVFERKGPERTRPGPEEKPLNRKKKQSQCVF